MAVTAPAGMPCRRCNQVPADGAVIVIYGRDEVGALVPKQVQHRNRCPDSNPGRPDRPSPGTVVTAYRPGKCSGCTWDIVPGDKITRDSEGGFYHFECSPAEDPPPRTRRRERARLP